MGPASILNKLNSEWKRWQICQEHLLSKRVSCSSPHSRVWAKRRSTLLCYVRCGRLAPHSNRAQ